MCYYIFVFWTIIDFRKIDNMLVSQTWAVYGEIVLYMERTVLIINISHIMWTPVTLAEMIG